jgi:hypothetical protein
MISGQQPPSTRKARHPANRLDYYSILGSLRVEHVPSDHNVTDLFVGRQSSDRVDGIEPRLAERSSHLVLKPAKWLSELPIRSVDNAH